MWTVKISGTDESREHWLDSERLSEEVKQEVREADIAILPFESWREYEHPVFPAHTSKVFRHIDSASPKGLRVGIASDDADYEELHLRSGFLLELGTFLVTNVALPIAINLITSYIVDRVGSKSEEFRLRIRFVVEQSPSSPGVKFSYDGPLDTFLNEADELLGHLDDRHREQIVAALDGVAEQTLELGEDGRIQLLEEVKDEEA